MSIICAALVWMMSESSLMGVQYSMMESVIVATTVFFFLAELSMFGSSLEKLVDPFYTLFPAQRMCWSNKKLMSIKILNTRIYSDGLIIAFWSSFSL